MVSDDEALAASAALCRGHGILCGISSGAAVHAAMLYARRPENRGSTVVALLPDTGERYLSGFAAAAAAE
jgi:cysteine synthase A